MTLPRGELVVIAFVTIAVLSAVWWPRIGAAIGELLVKRPSGDRRE
jgi:hypothetical protein